MTTFSVIKNRGVQTADNQLSGVPDGAHQQADNCIIRYRDVLEPRRGQKLLGQSALTADARTFGITSDRSNEGTFFRDALVVHYGDDKLSRDTGAAFSDYAGSYAPPDPTLLRMKFMEAADSLYFTTYNGPYVLDALTGTPAAAGVLRAIDMDRAETKLNGDPGDGWMEPSSQVAYRVVWGIKDANGRPQYGWPSGRVTVLNPADISADVGELSIAVNSVTVNQTNHGFKGGDRIDVSPGEANIPAGTYVVENGTLTANSFKMSPVSGSVTGSSNTAAQTLTSGNKLVTVRVDLPQGVTTSHYFRIYRSAMSPLATLPPGDDLFLVYEGTITSSDITTGYVDVIDRLSEVLLDAGFPLYTNPNTGDGIESANARPPKANDVCWWQDRAWYINTADRDRFTLKIIGVGSPAGVQAGDTITINTRTYTAGTDFEAWIYDSPAVNIERTAINLINAINADVGNTRLRAYYASAENEAPGKIELEDLAPADTRFVVYASRPSAWFPALTTGATGAQRSDNSRRSNGLSYSKVGQPESVPLGNFERIGPKHLELLRGIPLRDKLFLFPRQGGIYTLAGAVPPFRVDLLDGTTWLVAADTAVVHANQIFALTNQGVCAISEAGVRLVSKGIEDELVELLAAAPNAVKQYAFGVSYETERQYILYLPSSDADTCCTQAWVYNSLLDCWTHWTGNRTWGRVSPSEDLLYLGNGDSNAVRLERKAFAREDYADEALGVAIDTVSGTTVDLDFAYDVAIGDRLWQSDAVHALVIDVDGSTLTVGSTENFVAGAAQVLKAFACEVKYAPAVPAGPGILKQFRDLTLHFRSYLASLFSARFDSEKSKAESTSSVPAFSGYGMGGWGSSPFGTPSSGPVNRRIGVPREHEEGTQLRVGFSIREAWSQWALNGFSLEFQQGSERNSR